ncbi:MAG: RNA-binding cell elongation regulator Jag/EloR [Anaerovoracaceae bacterium]|nr:protein jag [Bacillota bacterium]MDY3954974.1 RNA-binding cell elongation regulator Jag/EloR [Anaerovoracaceae bacterium]
MDFSEKWGRDIKEAVNLALADLNLTEDQVTVTVLEEPSKGFLGLGAKLAKVRVEKKAEEPKKEEPKEEIKEEPEAVKEIKKETKKAEFTERRKEKRSENRRNNSSQNEEVPQKEEWTDYSVNIREKPENLEELEQSSALDFIKEVIEKMGLNLTVKAFSNEDCIYIQINGKDSGTIIGKRGQTLDSIQYLTSLVVNKDSEKYIRVIVDAENYRERREKTLEQLAKRLAEKVNRTGRSVRLEPMNPYERKVIHATLQKYSGVTTRSEGEEPYRRVIIEQK